MLIKCPGSSELSDRLEEKYDLDSVKVEKEVFPDGEIYVKLSGDVKGEDCYIVQTTYPNQHLIELFFIQDALYENGAEKVEVIVPYFSYGRQDKRFEPGEPVSARAIANRIQEQAESFYSVDLHSKEIVDFFDIPAENLSAMRLLADHAELYDPHMFVSPDEGGIERVKIAADEVDIDWDYIEKTRIDGETVEMETKKLDVEGKKVVLLDDIISTGGTMTEAATKIREQGADKVIAGCTHGLFVEDASERLDEICDDVFCTDTIECEKTEVTISPLLKDVID